MTRDQLKNGKNVPRRLNQLLEQILNGRILVNHDFYDYNNRIKILNRIANRFVISILFMALIIAASLLSLDSNMFLLARGLFGLSGIMFIWDIILIIKKPK